MNAQVLKAMQHTHSVASTISFSELPVALTERKKEIVQLTFQECSISKMAKNYF